MSLKSYPIELPDSAFSALRKTPAEFIQEMKYAAVVKWYEAGMISQDKAAEIAGLSRYAFLTLLARYDVSAIQYTPDLLDEELRHARGENRP
jgi:predicted HTH domain antitoxin